MRQWVPLPPSAEALDVVAGEAVVVVGTGRVLLPVVHALRQREALVHAICWSEPKAMMEPGLGIPALAIRDAFGKFPTATAVVVATPEDTAEWRLRLRGMGWIAVKDCAALLASFHYERGAFPHGLGWTHFDIDRYLYEYFLHAHPDLLVLPSLDVVITERCSLKCRDCANLMQYYSRPQDVTFEALFTELDVLMGAVDHVFELRVLGGETFMNKRAHEYVKRLQHYRNFSRIAVYSNGTIVPTRAAIESMANEHTYVRISNYGLLSRRLSVLVEELERASVTYEVDEMPGWHDCAEIGRRARSAEELEAVYSACCARQLLTILNGSVFLCPFSANATNLCAIPDVPEDRVDLASTLDRDEIRRRLVLMLRGRRFINACEYCGGRPMGLLPLPVARQVSTPLTYTREVDPRGRGDRSIGGGGQLGA